MPDPKKYRFEYWPFRTPKGIERKMVCVAAGKDEHKRLIVKAKEIARINQWKIVKN